MVKHKKMGKKATKKEVASLLGSFGYILSEFGKLYRMLARFVEILEDDVGYFIDQGAFDDILESESDI